MFPPMLADTTASRRTSLSSSILIHSRVYSWSPLSNLSNAVLHFERDRLAGDEGQDERVRHRARELTRRLVDRPFAPDIPPKDLPAVWTAPLCRLAELLAHTADPRFDARPTVRAIVVIRILLRGAHVSEA